MKKLSRNLFNFSMTLPPTVVIAQAAPVKRKKKSASIHYCFKESDIREMFAAPKKKKTPNVIVVDD